MRRLQPAIRKMHLQEEIELFFMPLNKKGEKIKKAMEREYGKKRGDSVFYASEKKGTIKGVTKSPQKKDK